MENQRFIARRAPLAVLLSLTILAAGCAATSPAPVVSRTPPNPVLPPVQTLPPGAVIPGALPPVVTAPAAEPADNGVQTSPIRSGSIESGSMTGASVLGGQVSPADPNLRTGPRAVKRPYSDTAVRSQPAIERPAGAAVAIPSQMPPIPTVAAPSVQDARPPSMTPPPAVPPVVSAPAPATAGSGLLDGVTFAWPSGGQVVESFDQTSSKGLSFNGRAGDAVLAAAEGRVIFSGAGPRGYGNLVIVKHAGELLSVYAHNRSLAVKEGDVVKRGQKIAELGNSGTDRPKLHFEIRQAGKPIDPIAVLPRR